MGSSVSVMRLGDGSGFSNYLDCGLHQRMKMLESCSKHKVLKRDFKEDC